MPKQKTHRGAAKRLWLTGSGKIARKRANRRHYLEHKSARHRRRLEGSTLVSPNDEKRARRLLGG